MVSLTKYGDNSTSAVCEITGLSTDTKPIDKIDGVCIGNGSTFIEMDTQKVFIFDKQNLKWREF